MTLATAKWLMSDNGRSQYRLAEIMREMYRQFPNAGYGLRFRRWLETPDARPYVSDSSGPAARVSVIGLMTGDLSEAIATARISAAVSHADEKSIQGAEAVTQAAWMARNGRQKDDIRFAMEHDFGYDLSMNSKDLSVLLRGYAKEPIIVNGQETGEYYLRDTGKIDTSSKLAVTAALTAFLSSDGFESAVRRAVSLGGESDVIASICGAIAEPFYGGVPEKINGLCSLYLDNGLRSRMDTVERQLSGKNIITGKMERRKDDSFKAIHVEGRKPMFVVSSYREDIIDALRDRFSDGMTVIRPSEYRSILAKLKDEGQDGTYLVSHHPDVRTLYFQNGEFRSPSTYECPGLASKEERLRVLNDFWEICDYAESVKKELQRRSGYDGEGSVHYRSAFYPVIGHDSVEIMQGDLLAGAVSIDSTTGLLNVSVDGDYSDGEYRMADWCRERVFPPYETYDKEKIKECIGRSCLDEGIGINDLSHTSNIETANQDIAESNDMGITQGRPAAIKR